MSIDIFVFMTIVIADHCNRKKKRKISNISLTKKIKIWYIGYTSNV